jgi:hypothetical protein
MRRVGLILALALATIANRGECLANDEKVPLNVLYLSRQEDAGRVEAFRDFLTASFAKLTVAKRDDFQSGLLEGIDVVLLDWPQSERPSSSVPSPLGPIEKWNTPLVLLGSAGLLQSRSWSVIGSAG